MFGLVCDYKLMLAKLRGNVIEYQICSVNFKQLNHYEEVRENYIVKEV